MPSVSHCSAWSPGPSALSVLPTFLELFTSLPCIFRTLRKLDEYRIICALSSVHVYLLSCGLGAIKRRGRFTHVARRAKRDQASCPKRPGANLRCGKKDCLFGLVVVSTSEVSRAKTNLKRRRRSQDSLIHDAEQVHSRLGSQLSNQYEESSCSRIYTAHSPQSNSSRREGPESTKVGSLKLQVRLQVYKFDLGPTVPWTIRPCDGRPSYCL